MANLIFTNNASALLAASIDEDDLTIQVAGGFGVLFPLPGGSQFFHATLENADGDIEVVRVTARSGDNLTVVRGQDNTSARSWTQNVTRVELRLVAASMEHFLQKSGGTMSGDIDLDGNDLIDANLTGAPVINGGQTVATAIRGVLDQSSNEIAVPSSGPATSGGSAILTAATVVDVAISGAGLPVGMIIMWGGVLASIPAGWQLCDGTNSTPDLRGAFPRGAGGDIDPGDTGGAASVTSGSDGTGNTGSTALTIAQMPAHNHRIFMGPVGHQLPSGPTNMTSYGAHSGGSNDYRNIHSSGSGTGIPNGTQYIQDAGEGEGHTHTGPAHTHSVDTVPPFVGVYFIQKVS